jgi:hypothetical protein
MQCATDPINYKEISSMLYQNIKIVRDLHTVYNRLMPEWELPVVMFIFDDGNVQPQGTFERVDRLYPSAQIEYERLEKRYGQDSQSGVPYVTSIYGPGARGVAAIQKIIDEAEADEQEQIRAGTAPKVKLADIPEQVALRDPLLA